VTLVEKILANLHVMVLRISSAIAAGAMTAAGWWIQLPRATRTAYEADYPLLVTYGPWITLAAWVIANAWPQKAVTRVVLDTALKSVKARAAERAAVQAADQPLPPMVPARNGPDPGGRE